MFIVFDVCPWLDFPSPFQSATVPTSLHHLHNTYFLSPALFRFILRQRRENLQDFTPAAACWLGWTRPAERKRGPQTRGRAAGRHSLTKEGPERKRGRKTHPPVPLSYWPKAGPASATSGDITLWSAAGEGGANAASRRPGNRSSPLFNFDNKPLF